MSTTMIINTLHKKLLAFWKYLKHFLEANMCSMNENETLRHKCKTNNLLFLLVTTVYVEIYHTHLKIIYSIQ